MYWKLRETKKTEAKHEETFRWLTIQWNRVRDSEQKNTQIKKSESIYIIRRILLRVFLWSVSQCEGTPGRHSLRPSPTFRKNRGSTGRKNPKIKSQLIIIKESTGFFKRKEPLFHKYWRVNFREGSSQRRARTVPEDYSGTSYRFYSLICKKKRFPFRIKLIPKKR